MQLEPHAQHEGPYSPQQRPLQEIRTSLPKLQRRKRNMRRPPISSTRYIQSL